MTVHGVATAIGVVFLLSTGAQAACSTRVEVENRSTEVVKIVAFEHQTVGSIRWRSIELEEKNKTIVNFSEKRELEIQFTHDAAVRFKVRPIYRQVVGVKAISTQPDQSGPRRTSLHRIWSWSERKGAQSEQARCGSHAVVIE